VQADQAAHLWRLQAAKVVFLMKAPLSLAGDSGAISFPNFVY